MKDKLEKLFASAIILAQNNPTDVFGQIQAPAGISKFGGVETGGPTAFITTLIKLMIVGAGLFTVFNLVTAGYAFLSAGDDPKKVQAAWKKIWQSVLGLTVAAGSMVLAAIFGKLIFNDFNALLQLRIFGPGV